MEIILIISLYRFDCNSFCKIHFSKKLHYNVGTFQSYLWHQWAATKSRLFVWTKGLSLRFPWFSCTFSRSCRWLFECRKSLFSLQVSLPFPNFPFTFNSCFHWLFKYWDFLFLLWLSSSFGKFSNSLSRFLCLLIRYRTTVFILTYFSFSRQYSLINIFNSHDYVCLGNIESDTQKVKTKFPRRQ